VSTEDRLRSSSEPDFESLGYMVIVEHPAKLTGRVFYTLYERFDRLPAPEE
jgi:hypothetical protein